MWSCVWNVETKWCCWTCVSGFIFFSASDTSKMFKITAMCGSCDVYYHIWVIRTFTVNCEEGNDGTRNNRETTEQSRNNGTTPEHQISGDIRVRILQELDLVDFWSWNLHVVYMCLHGLVFVVIVKTKKSLIICQLCCWKVFQLSKFMQHLFV